jgi:hypothetical protein
MASPTQGPHGQLYADPVPSPDETAFQQDNTSEEYYNSPYYEAHEYQVQAFPAAANTTPLNLTSFLPAESVSAITSAGKIVFHAVGDTGAAKVSSRQTAAEAIANEARVADAMTKDVAASDVAFFFHLGDVIYEFGEAQYYYDQFYEPYRNYDRPIFAIPGNHDGMVFGEGSSAPSVPSLAAFLTNFCAATAAPSPDAGGIMRTTMTQPGVYFSLDAPFVSIIGLYSNVLEGPGVISSQGGAYPINDEQLNFLQAQLLRLKMLRTTSPRAVILALHHPPLSVDAKHGGSTGPLADIDTCCAAAGFWPDMVLSGHAHLYQRFTRTVAAAGGKQTPYLVSGSGGYAATPPQAGLPAAPVTVGDATLEINPIVDFGYLTLTCDGATLTASFTSVDASGVTMRDSVSVDLANGTIVHAAAKPSKGKSKPKPKHETTKKARRK